MEINTLMWFCCLEKSNLMEDKRKCKLSAEGTHLLENQRVEPQKAHPTSEFILFSLHKMSLGYLGLKDAILETHTTIAWILT